MPDDDDTLHPYDYEASRLTGSPCIVRIKIPPYTYGDPPGTDLRVCGVVYEVDPDYHKVPATRPEEV